MIDPRTQVMNIVRERLDATTAAIIEAAFADHERIKVIRDMFLEGRDVEAVQLIRELDPVGLRKLLPCGSNPHSIQIGQSAQISARPQIPFTPTHLLVSRSCAAAFVVNDIRVGQRSELVSSGEVPADIFAVDAPVLEDEGGFDASRLTPEGFDVVKTFMIRKSAEERMPVPLDMPEVPVGVYLTVVVTKVAEPDPANLAEWRAAWLGKTRQH